jgi:hypothetical protein
MDNNQKTSSGTGFTGLLTLIFITLKLTGTGTVAAWSWVWVLSPLWIGWTVAILVIFAVFVYSSLSNRKTNIPF